MASYKTYSEKLKDPRWQKKRLEILERDKWMCKNCRSTDKTLHVHHRLYEKGVEPWETKNKYLVTLCDECHKITTKYYESFLDEHIKLIRLYFNVNQLSVLTTSIERMLNDYMPAVTMLTDILSELSINLEVANELLEIREARKNKFELEND